jgi:hypothetical protein
MTKTREVLGFYHLGMHLKKRAYRVLQSNGKPYSKIINNWICRKHSWERWCRRIARGRDGGIQGCSGLCISRSGDRSIPGGSISRSGDRSIPGGSISGGGDRSMPGGSITGGGVGHISGGRG